MTSYFEIQGCTNRKQKKGSIYVAVEKQQEKERLKETERQIKRQVGVMRQLKTGRPVLTD